MQENQSNNQQGYLQYLHNNAVQKVFVILNRNRLLCYLDDPTKSSVRMTPIHSIDLSASKLIESGPNLTRPKSFQFTSSDGTVVGEFVCPTNSIKLQWVKSIMDYSEGPSSTNGNAPVPSNNPFVLSPKPFTSRSQSPTKGLTSSLGSQTFVESAPAPQLLSASSSGTRQLGHLSAALHLGHKPPTGMPTWISPSFGLHDIKSRKVSPQRTGSSSAFTDLDKVTIHRNHNRAQSPPTVTASTTVSFQPQHSGGRGGSGSSSGRVEDMTVGELREALRSMPPHLRNDLLHGEHHSDAEQHHHQQQQQQYVQDRQQHARSKHQQLQSSGEFEGGGRSGGRSQSAGPSGRTHNHPHRSDREYTDGSGGDQGQQQQQRQVLQQRERARSAGPNYMRQTEQSYMHIRTPSTSGRGGGHSGSAGNEEGNIFYYDESERHRDDPRGDRYYSSAQRPPQSMRNSDRHNNQHHQQQQRQNSNHASSRERGSGRHESDRIVLDVVYRPSDHHLEEQHRGGRHDPYGEYGGDSYDHDQGMSEEEEEEEQQSVNSYQSDDFFETPQHLQHRQSHQNYSHSTSRQHSSSSGGGGAGGGRVSSLNNQHHSHQYPTDVTMSPARKYQTPVTRGPLPTRSKSSSPTRGRHVTTSGGSGGDHLASSSEMAKQQRSASAHHDSRVGGGVVTTEAERKSALEWSRRNALDKQYRTEFPASPIHSGSSSGNLLKYKYQSFHNSLEREESNANAAACSAAATMGRSTSPTVAAALRLSGSLERKTSELTMTHEKSQPSYMGSKHKDPHASSSNNSGSGGLIRGASGSGFNAFLNSRKSSGVGSSSGNRALAVVPPANPPPPGTTTAANTGGAAGAVVDPLVRVNQDLLARYRAKQPPPAPGDVPAVVVRKSSKKQLIEKQQQHPPMQQQAVHGQAPSLTNPGGKNQTHSSAVAAATATGAQQHYQQSQLHQRRPAPLLHSFDDLSSIDQEISRIRSYSTDLEYGVGNGGVIDNMTDVAEWRRLTDWLKRNEFERYIRAFRENGVTKLSIVELLTEQDMTQIGIEPDDKARMLKKVGEFTRRTRTFSEQVLSPQKSPEVDRVSSSEYQQQLQHQQQQQQHSKRHTASGASNAGGRIDPAVRTSSKPKHVNPYASRVYANKGDIRRDLISAFDSGNHDLFFHAWRTAILAHFPPDYAELNPARPTQYQTKQVMEFHLYLYFSVFPIMNQRDKDEIKSGKNCLKEYLETMLVTSEIDSWGTGLLDASATSAAAVPFMMTSASSPPESSLNSPTLRSTGGTHHSSATAFMRSKEFAVYAGLVMVPEPQSNEAFAQLFKQDWMMAMRSRFIQFLDIVGFSEASVSINLSEQLEAAADDNAEAVETENAAAEAKMTVADLNVNIPAPSSTEAALVTPKVTPRASYTGMKSSHVVVVDSAPEPASAPTATSVVAAEGLSKSQQSARLLQESQQVAAAATAAEVLGPVPAVVTSVGTIPVPNTNVVTLPRSAAAAVSTSGVPANALSPISPVRRFSKGLAAMAAATAAAAASGAAGGGAAGGQPGPDQITSPMSTTSTISQLTDDDGDLNEVQPHHTGHRVGGVHGKSLAKSYPAAGAAGGGGAVKSTTGHKTGKNPLTKSAMQQQVNEYNKLLRNSGGAGAAAPARPSITSLSQAATITAAEAAAAAATANESGGGSASEGEGGAVSDGGNADNGKTSATTASAAVVGRNRSSLVVGGNVKPRLTPSAPAGAPPGTTPATASGPSVASAASTGAVTLKIGSGNRESMQSQVNVYTKLLKQKQAERRSSASANAAANITTTTADASAVVNTPAAVVGETEPQLPEIEQAPVVPEKRQSIISVNYTQVVDNSAASTELETAPTASEVNRGEVAVSNESE